ncbi:MAG: hypothetical protein HFI86_04465 [Bacilli bacterium]|nr:hypothetical protein [Bacilli bacterium]
MFGNRKQVTRHNKDWIGLDGKNKAQQEENVLKCNYIKYKPEKREDITFKKLFYLKIQNDELYNKNSKSTRITYEQKMTSHVFPILGDKVIYKLVKKDFDELLSYLKTYTIKKGVNKGKNLKINFINDILLVVKSIINFGITFYNLDKELLNFINHIQENRDKIQKPDPLKLIKKTQYYLLQIGKKLPK